MPLDDVVEHIVTFALPFDVRAGRIEESRASVRAGIARWIDAGLVRPSPDGRVDPVECANALKTAGLTGGGDPLWDAYLETGRRLVTASSPGDASAPPSWRLRFRRIVSRDVLKRSRDRVRIRVPLPLESHHGDIAIESVEGSRAVLESRRSAGGLDVFLAEGDATVEAAVTMSFCETPPRATEDLDRYLRRDDGLATTTAWVRDLADGFGSDPVEGCWRFLFGLRSGHLHHHLLDAEDPLRSAVAGGVLDCYVGAALIVAVCRARGIPARIVGGVALFPTAPCHHYWAEVFRDGAWLPYDLMSWDLARGRIEDVEWGRRFFGKTSARLVTQRLPDAITGAPGFAPPRRWLILCRVTARGTSSSMYDVDTGRFVCADEVEIAT